jgi:hypothetical protein
MAWVGFDAVMMILADSRSLTARPEQADRPDLKPGILAQASFRPPAGNLAAGSGYS